MGRHLTARTPRRGRVPGPHGCSVARPGPQLTVSGSRARVCASSSPPLRWGWQPGERAAGDWGLPRGRGGGGAPPGLPPAPRDHSQVRFSAHRLSSRLVRTWGRIRPALFGSPQRPGRQAAAKIAFSRPRLSPPRWPPSAPGATGPLCSAPWLPLPRWPPFPPASVSESRGGPPAYMSALSRTEPNGVRPWEGVHAVQGMGSSKPPAPQPHPLPRLRAWTLSC